MGCILRVCRALYRNGQKIRIYRLHPSAVRYSHADSPRLNQFNRVEAQKPEAGADALISARGLS